MGDQRLRLVLVEDHALVRAGLRALIEQAEDIDIVGEAGTVSEALAEVASKQPNIVLLDVRLPDGSGSDACRAIRAIVPTTRVLMLSAFDDEIVQAIQAGASGYVTKSTKLAELLAAIRIVGRGEAFLSSSATNKVLDFLRAHQDQPEVLAEPGDDRLAHLSNQEQTILMLIAEGKTNREIGRALTLSEHTIKVYVSNLLTKLGGKERLQKVDDERHRHDGHQRVDRLPARQAKEDIGD